MHEQEQQEDLGVGTSALGFLPATQIEKCLFKVLIVFNDNRALLFCLLALSVRRKWERKFGLFIALPVASDLRFVFSSPSSTLFQHHFLYLVNNKNKR